MQQKILCCCLTVRCSKIILPLIVYYGTTLEILSGIFTAMKKVNIIVYSVLVILLAVIIAGCGAAKTANEQITPDTAAASAAPSDAPVDSPKPEKFRYIHNPRDNPNAMKDIIENPDAVYGFSPSPNSTRLKNFVDYDWSDAKTVESGRQERIAYHKSLEGMYEMLLKLRAEGKSIEEIARAISTERNRLRLEAYKDNPEGLEKAKKSNLETYGHEEGPLPDELFEKYGSWETVIQKAFGTNPGMDACCGLYDDYYDLYVELGMDK